MILYFAADSHGQIQKLYDRIQDKINWTGVQPDWVIHVGSLGVWPDPKRIDRATKLRGNNTDFHRYYLTTTPVPYRTLFLPGKHEDHRWIRSMFHRQYLELVPNLHNLVSGYIKVLSKENESIKVIGLGKVYSPKSYEGLGNPKKSVSHYTKQEVERACAQGPVDLVLSTEAAKGSVFGNITSQALGISNIYSAVRPTLAVHGHYNQSSLYVNKITKTPVLSLNYSEIVAINLSGGKFERI